MHQPLLRRAVQVCASVLFAFAATAMAFATPTTGCTLYVDGDNGSDTNNGSTLALAFKSPQAAEDWLENNVALQSTYVVHGNTYKKYTLNSAQKVCIKARSGNAPYDAANASQASLTDRTTRPYPQISTEAYTLEIKVSGTASYPLTFTAYDPSAFPTIRQTGYSAIQIDSTANYVTISFLSVKGRAYDADKPTATGRYATTNSPANWAIYDGACIYVKGNAIDYTLKQYSRTVNVQDLFPVAVPTHITLDYNNVYACGGGGIGSQQTDYFTVTHNTVYDNAWWGIFGGSGISALDSVDSETYPTPPNQATSPVTTVVKTRIFGNKVFDNREYVPWRDAYGGPSITDGEGIIIDTNRNGTFNYSDGSGSYTMAAYQGQSTVDNNLVWNNGSSGIEVLQSENTTVSNNTLYNNRYYPSGYTIPSQLSTPKSSIATRPEISANYLDGVVNLYNNVIYGPTPIPNHACGTTYIANDANNPTYTCYAASGMQKDYSDTDPQNTFVNLANNVYYEPNYTLDDPGNHILKVNTNTNNSINVDPRLAVVESQISHSAYGDPSSTVTPNFRILSGTPTSPAVNRDTTAYPYVETYDIVNATQPGTSKLAGAYAVTQ